MIQDIISVIRKETVQIYDSQTAKVLFMLSAGLVLIPLLPLLVLIAILLMQAVSPQMADNTVQAMNGTMTSLNQSTTQAHPQGAGESYGMMAAYILVLLLFPSKVISDTIARELEKGNAEPLLATPVRTRDILLGKLIAANIAPQLPLYAGVILSSILFKVLRYGGDGMPFPSLGIYVSMLFVLVPICIMTDSIVVAVLRLAFKNGFMQRVMTAWLTPGSVVSFCIIGAFVYGRLDVLPTITVPVSLALLAACILLFPVLVRVYDRDNIVMKMKEA